MKRKEFIATGAALSIAALNPTMILSAISGFDSKQKFPSHRPSLSDRTFRSDEIEDVISKMKERIKDPEIAWMFENCFPNTLDTTVDYEEIDGKPDTFIITGDIDAMWLRDSTAQVWPYMPFILKDEKLRKMVQGLINRQVKCVLTDPYANAFYKDLNRKSHWESDQPSPAPGVHERKWEIDSLCYVIRLANKYYELTSDTTIFDEQWNRAMRLIVSTFRTEQRKDGTSPYRFARQTTAMIDAPVFNGTGRPVKPTGLICSMFRPSDDATLFPYLIPSNLFAAQSLIQLSSIYSKVFNDNAFASECVRFAIEINTAVQQYALTEHLAFGKMYAYEVDGFGNRLFMDDANVPSLMSLPYLGILETGDEFYKNTRRFLLSGHNPYFLKGKSAEGQASPHTGKDKIWPMGIILRAMTSTDTEEIILCLKMLKETHADTGFMHEAFHKDRPEDYNRSWFAWANTLFGELIIHIQSEFPEILNLEF